MSDKDIFTTEDTLQGREKLSKLFDILLTQYDEALRRDPEFAQTLSQLSNEYERRIDESLSRRAPPLDGGLASLVGLGDDAAEDLGHVPPPVLLPSIDESVASERLLAVADLYYVMEIERTGILRAVLALQDLFKRGQLRLSDGPGAYNLYKFDQQKTLRYSGRERFRAYARVFGFGRGGPEAPRNTPFFSLFNGFVSSVATFFRDTRISSLFHEHRAPSPRELSFGSIATVRRSGLNLRENLKRASYGHVNVLRIEALQILRQAFAILEASDIKREYGAEDGWDALEQIMLRHLQEDTAPAMRARLATSGRQILSWLAQPYILSANRTTFETALLKIGDSCEEWLTTFESLDIMRENDSESEPDSNIVRFRRRHAR
jgi:hypothetical protein